ncbi:MAG TPA: Gldg family protein [Vicinamibacteria bacterium]|nr:Gldg family protein [Vicinamibacteria bacterium]
MASPDSGRLRPFDVLAPLGLLVLVGTLAWQRLSTRPLPGQPRWYFAAAAALVLAHLVLRWDDVAARVGRRQMRYGANTAVLVLTMLALLVGVNYLANRRNKSWDLTKGQRHSLSEQTVKVLDGLQKDVTLTYFERSSQMQPGKERLEQYRQRSSRVKVVYVDPVVDPAPAREFEITGPTVVVAVGPRTEKVANVSEQDITNAIIKATRGARKTVCFVEGEGERDIDDGSQRGYSGVKAALGKTQYDTRKVFLAREGTVPADCTVLVVAAPEKDLLPPAVEAIRRFVKAGGKALLLVEPDLRGSTPSLVSLAADWNLQVGSDVVVDSSGMGQIVGGGPLTPVVLNYPYHDITKDLADVMTAFHTARSVQAGTGGAAGIAAQNVAETFEASWAETDLALKGQVRFDEGQDRRGPVSLAAVATLSGTALDPLGASPPPVAPSSAPALEGPVIASPGPLPPSSPSPALDALSASPSPSPPAPAPSPSPDESKREARVAVFGDADFASNALLQVQGNQDLFVNAVAWLAQDPDLMSIRAREPEDHRLFLTQQQQGNVRLVSLVLLPGALLAMGIASWWRRRG